MKKYFLRSFLALAAAILLSVVVVTHIAFMSVMRQIEERPSGTMKVVSSMMAERFAEMSLEEALASLEPKKAELGSEIGIVPVEDSVVPADVAADASDSGMMVRRFRTGMNYSLMIYVPVRIEGRQMILVAGPIDRPYGPDKLAYFYMGILILMIMLLSSMVFAFPMWRRLRILEKTARQVAEGQLDARIPIPADDGMVGFLASQFNTMVERVEKLLASQKMMMQAVSHELRTPTARIRFSLEMLDAAEDPAERERRLQAIDDDLTDLDDLVEELLVFNKAEALGTDIERSPFKVLPALEKMVEKRAFLRSGVVVDLDCPNGLIEVLADGRAFVRAIGNLLSNALRFTRTSVRIVVRSDGDAVMVAVLDDGPGVPVEDRATILQPFKRLDSSRNRESGGAGLGLAIVSSIVSAHGGRIEIRDSEAGGAAFHTWWPAA